MKPDTSVESLPESRGRFQLTRNIGTVERIISAAAGAALVAGGLRRRNAAGALAALAGGALVFRGASGHCFVKAALVQQGESGTGQAESAVLEHGKGFDLEKSVVVQRTPDELYAFWRNFENLPLFMDRLHAVTLLDATRSRWVAEGPAGQRIEWDAEIINDEPGERIGWRSLPGSEITHAGSVQFLPAGEGTEVRVHMRYDPPFGRAGKVVANLFRKNPEKQIAAELRRFKHLMEAGDEAITP